MPEHRVRVDNGKYELCKTNTTGAPYCVEFRRHGQLHGTWYEGINALSAVMAELDAARVVLEAARKLGDEAPPEIKAALAHHGRLVDDRELPSDWTR